VLKAQGQFQDALNAFRAGLGIRERLAKTDPDNIGWQRDLAASYQRIGDTHERLAQIDAAKAAFERAHAIYAALLAKFPGNVGLQLASTIPLMRLGELSGAEGRAYLEQALAILKRLDAAGRLEPQGKAAIAWIEQQLEKLKAAQIPPQ